jgi:hypothetical protein
VRRRRHSRPGPGVAVGRPQRGRLPSVYADVRQAGLTERPELDGLRAGDTGVGCLGEASCSPPLSAAVALSQQGERGAIVDRSNRDVAAETSNGFSNERPVIRRIQAD